MNTSALKPFSQQARTLLRAGVERQLTYWGFDKNGKTKEILKAVTGGYTFRGKVSDDVSVPLKWNKLQTAIDDSSYDEVVEKAAYTWFNRLMAMKILSKNGYETAQLDYLTGDTLTPAILERARRGQYAYLSKNEQQRLQAVLTDYEKDQEAFAIALIGYCHQHPLLQGIFGSIDDYTELLLPEDILTKKGFLYFLNTSDAIKDEDYKQVELIGWLYQFYISEKKDEVFAGFKENKKGEAKDIPAATQIFTPNWIVKYLVQNTLGRTWLDAHPESDLKKDWSYLVETPKDQEDHSIADLKLETVSFLDPSVGSGHILVEAFDVLYPMYMTEYYNPEEAVETILRNNLFGIDLDLRAAQLAQFALLLKAAQYSRSVLQGDLLPHIYAMPQHRSFTQEEVLLFLGKDNAEYSNQLYKALQVMKQADNLGSIMVLELSENARSVVYERDQYWQKRIVANFEEKITKETFHSYIPILFLLTKKFSCIAANPPYMGQKNMNAALKNYVNEFYPLTKSDLFSVFMDVCTNLLQKEGRYGMINMQSWMFLSSFEEMRSTLLQTQVIESMLHLGPRTFDELSGEVVQNTAFVLKNKINTEASGTYYRLVNFRSTIEKKEAFERRENKFDDITQSNFKKIPGSPIAYWVSPKALQNFDKSFVLKRIGDTRQGMATSDNERFTRLWHEVSFTKVGFLAKSREEAKDMKKKWFPYNKGGGFRKWYGNQGILVNWENDGQEVLGYASDLYGSPTRTIKSISEYFKPSLSWSKVSGGDFSIRYYPHGFIFDVAGCCIFLKDEKYYSYLACLLNSNVAKYYLSILSPTLNYEAGSIASFPVIETQDSSIAALYQKAKEVCKADWDLRETSWDFLRNPIIATEQPTLQQSYERWLQQISKDFFQLHAGEEELNRIFIELYGLQEELTPHIPLKDIAILQEELNYAALEEIEKPYEDKRIPVHADVVMQQLISYIAGCYMGRYRLDKPGLHIAHPDPSEDELVPYFVKTGNETHFQFQIDDDAIIPIMGSNGNFTDDMMHRVREFLSIIWGEDSLTANINFLQQKLDKNIEDYLVKDFWKYHLKTYSKKPIYWLFASKKGAFQVLVYMHRVNSFTLTKIRSKYLIPHIGWLHGRVADMEKNAAMLSKIELKKLDTFRKQLVECEEYDLSLKDMAVKQIGLNLDDGVTKNYALFKEVVAGIK